MDIDDSSTTTSSYTVPDLEVGVAYTFHVRALVGGADPDAGDPTLVIGDFSAVSNSVTPLPLDTPTLPPVTDKLYAQDVAVDFTLPAATDGGSNAYTYTLTPDVSGIGLTFTASTRKLGGTPSAPKAQVAYTYTAAETSDTDGTTESVSDTFTIGIQPKATTLSGSPGNGVAHLSWTALAGVSGREYLQNEKDATTNETWTAITGSSATTAKHTVTGLDNAKEYDFTVRAVIGSGGTRVDDVESNLVTVDVANQTPTLTGTIADQALTQGASYTSATAFPTATGGDGTLTYSVANLPTASRSATTASWTARPLRRWQRRS